MNKAGLEKWFQRDVRKTGELELPEAGVILELEGLDWKQTQNLLKKNTIPRKDGSTIRNHDGYLMDVIASAIKKANGETFNLYERETLEVIGVKSHDQAINKLFTVTEVNKLIKLANELSGDTPEAEKEEVEELKNSSEATI